MSKWIIYKREGLHDEEGPTFGVDVYENFYEEEEPRTLAPSENPEGLAKLVVESGLRVDFGDEVATIPGSILIPANMYIDFPVTHEEIIRFNRRYEELVAKEEEKS